MLTYSTWVEILYKVLHIKKANQNIWILLSPCWWILNSKHFFLIFHLGLHSFDKMTWVLYMSSSDWLLGVESRDFSYAEKERTACKAEQIYKMTTIFTQITILFVNLLRFASSSFFLCMRKITWLNSQQPKTREHVEHHDRFFIANGTKPIYFVQGQMISKVDKYGTKLTWKKYI